MWDYLKHPEYTFALKIEGTPLERYFGTREFEV
jgi:hypothetical protein